MRVPGLLVLILMLASAVGAGAQSLGEVARKEAERRKAVKAPGKTYTNDQLKSDGRDVPVAPAAPADSTAKPSTGSTPATGGGTAKAGDAAGQKDAGPKDQATAKEPAKEPAKDEDYWRKRLQTEREALSRAQMFGDALQSRINGLTTDFTARDDPAARAAIGADRQKSLDELARVKKEIEQHTKAIADIQEEARRSGAPAGWVR